MTPVAYLWVSRPAYEEYRQVCVDGDELPIHYDTYLNKLKQFSENLRAVGIPTAQVNVKPQALVDWSLARKIPVNTKARNAFAAFLNVQLRKNG